MVFESIVGFSGVPVVIINSTLYMGSQKRVDGVRFCQMQTYVESITACTCTLYTITILCNYYIHTRRSNGRTYDIHMYLG